MRPLHLLISRRARRLVAMAVSFRSWLPGFPGIFPRWTCAAKRSSLSVARRFGAGDKLGTTDTSKTIAEPASNLAKASEREPVNREPLLSHFRGRAPGVVVLLEKEATGTRNGRKSRFSRQVGRTLADDLAHHQSGHPGRCRRGSVLRIESDCSGAESQSRQSADAWLLIHRTTHRNLEFAVCWNLGECGRCDRLHREPARQYRFPKISSSMSVSLFKNIEPKIALPLASRTVFTSTPTLSADGFKGLHWWLDVGIASGTGGLTVQIATVDPIFGGVIGGYIFGTAKTTTGLVTGFIYPGAESNQFNAFVASLGLVVPPRFRLSVNVGDASSYTYRLSYAFIE